MSQGISNRRLHKQGSSFNFFSSPWVHHYKIRILHLTQVRYARHSSSRACLADKNTYSQCDWVRQACYYSAHLTDGNAISKRVFMIRIYNKPLMTYLYFAAFYMTVTPLLASARKPLCYLWSKGISLTAVCQSSAAYDFSMWMNLSSQAPEMGL